MKKLYLVGSLRNKKIPEIANRLRKSNPDFEVFDDWFAAGPEADDYWKAYEKGRGRTYQEALDGYSAKHVFAFDKHHIDMSSHVVLVLPAGKSGHMEVTYAKYGANAKTAILLEDGADIRYDCMYQFVDRVLENEAELIEWLEKTSDVTSTEVDVYGWPKIKKTVAADGPAGWLHTYLSPIPPNTMGIYHP